MTTISYWLSSALAVVATIVAAATLLLPGLFRDPAVWVGSAQGTAIVILTLGVPSLVLGMILSSRGSARGAIVWLGALGYLFYNGVIFSFGVAFNALFLGMVAMLSLSVWSVVAVLVRLDPRDVRDQFADRLPVRTIAGYQLLVAAGFGFLWLSGILPALGSGTRPPFLEGTELLTNPIHVLDLGFTLPVTITGAIWLLRRRAWGYVVSGVMLVGLFIETVSIAFDQYFGALADPNTTVASFTMVPVFVVLAVLALVPTIVYLIAMTGAPTSVVRAAVPAGTSSSPTPSPRTSRP